MFKRARTKSHNYYSSYYALVIEKKNSRRIAINVTYLNKNEDKN